MKLFSSLTVILATLPILPPGAPPVRIDITGKPNVAIDGAGEAKIQILSKRDAEILVVYYPKTGVTVLTNFQSGAYQGLVIERRSGTTKSVLYDSDGDGLPEVRHVFEILPNGEEKLTKIEQLTCTVLNSK